MAIEILEGPLLSQKTTLRLGGRAIAEVVLKNEKDFAELPEVLKKLGGKPVVIGWGSNILACDGDLPLTLVRMDFTEPPAIIEQQGQEVSVQVSAFTPLAGLLNFCAQHGFGGLEGLSGIPGQIGGAIAMNAGSYGQEIGNVLESVTIFVPGQGIKTLAKGEFDPSYRKFAFAGSQQLDYWVVLKAHLRLRVVEPENLRLAMLAFKKRKAATQPLQAFSAGCAFCNPGPELSAGKILDELGFKGRSLGGMMFSDLHANFLVNTGQGSSAEALELLDLAKQVALKEKGLALKLEIKVYP